MKVIHLCRSVYPQSLGGVEIYVQTLVTELVKKGYEVRVIVTDAGARENFGKGDSNKIFLGTNLRVILKILNNEHYDCLHIHSFASLGALELGIVLLFNKLRKKKPVIITPHGSFNSIIYVYYNMGLRFLLQRAYILYLRKLSTLVDFFTVFTQHQRDLWGRLGFPIEKVVVLPPFAKLDEEEKKWFSVNKNTKNVLCVGRLSKEKGIDFLLRAIPKVMTKISDVKLHIVGEGQTKKDLDDLTYELGIENAVIFHGHVPHERLAEIYRKSDVFVLPSVCAEAFSLSLLEAMERGLPVVTTNIGGQAELVTPSFNGELVNPRDPEGLAEKISVLLSNPALAKVLGENAKISARNFGTRKHIEKLEELYNRACGIRNSRRDIY